MAHLESLINPKSVALIGVSRNVEGAFHSLKTLLDYGYQGDIFVIHPKADNILNVKTIINIAQLPLGIDVLVVTLPREAVPGAVKEAVKRGVKNIVIVTQGFSDLGAEGKQVQDEMVDIARLNNTRILGPNTLGVANPFAHFTTVISPIEIEIPQPIGTVCQTGIFVVGFSKLNGKRVDIGNGSDIQFEEIVELYGDDDDIKVINLQIESLRNGSEFFDAINRTIHKKPIIALKSGRSKLGAVAAASHSGAMAGEKEIYDAAFKQFGIIQVEDIDELNDLNKAFINLPAMKGKNVAVLTVSGGLGIISIDACEKYGLEIANLSKQTILKIQNFSPDWAPITNPVDIWPAMSVSGYRSVYRDTIDALIKDDNVNAIFCIFYAFSYEKYPDIDVSDVIKEYTKKTTKPIVTWYYGPYSDERIKEYDKKGGVVTFSTPERAMRALASMYRYEKSLTIEAHESEKLNKTISSKKKRQVERIIDAAVREGRKEIGFGCFDILKVYGVPVAKAVLVNSLIKAKEESKKLSYPIAIKIATKDIYHKTDIGGVRLGIQDERSLETEYKAIVSAIKNSKDKLRIEGVILEEMINGKELIIGLKRNNVFGPVIVFGMGGIYTEIMHDVAFRIAPLNLREARSMIEDTKIKEILMGARGEKAIDIMKLADTISKISSLGVEFPQIKEIDINPFIVNEDRQAAVDIKIFV